MIGDIRKFRFWCQKVLPLVYDDSLSYYEVLCKLVQYLNKVIEDVNSIPDYIDAVIDERLSDEHLQELIEQFAITIENAVSSNNEGDNTNSSADYNVGQMLWWNGKLYRVIRQIDAGDTLIAGTNLEIVNFEDLFNDFVDEVKHDITANDDGNSTTATQSWETGTWLWLNDVLYIVKSDIAEGNAYVFSGDNANVEQITVEGEIKKEATARADADTAITDNIGDLDELTTTDKASLVNAINEINATGGGTKELIGDLADLETTDKTDVVSAINEVNRYKHYVNVKMLGAKGDGVTDDTTVIQNAINTYECIYIPSGEYLISDTIEIERSVIIAGAGTLATVLIRATSFNGTMIEIANAISCEIVSLRIANGGKLHNVYDTSNKGISIVDASSGNYKFDEVWIDSGYVGFYFKDASNIRINNCTVFQESAYSNNGYMTECGIQFVGHCTGIWIDNSFISGQDINSQYFMHIGMLIQGADGIYVTNTGLTAKIGVFMTNQYAYLDDVYFANCILDNCTQSFIGSESGGSTNVFNNIMFDNCHMDMVGGATGDPGIVIDGKAMNFKLSNSFVGGCSGNGITLRSGTTYNNKANHDHSITNCYIVGVNQANLAGQVGIAVQCAGCTINGNTVTNSGIRDGHAKYALTVEADDILVAGNKLATMETDYIYQQGGLSGIVIAANSPASVNA